MYPDTLYITDLFNAVIQSMRDTYTFTGIAIVSTGVYKVSTSDTKNLSDGDYVTISGTTNWNGQYRISGLVENVSFNIEKTGTILTESGTWTANAPYFKYGHLREITNMLSEKDKSENYKYQKYPLIVLLLDISEKKGIDAIVYSEILVRVWICCNTRKEYTSESRTTNSFKAILQPIYDLFIQKLESSGYFNYDKLTGFSHTKTDRYFWGLDDGTVNVFNDFIDAIDIENLELKIKKQFNTCNNGI
jgi:hypothetical protein